MPAADGELWEPIDSTAGERIAVRTLEEIATAQESFRRRNLVDVDGDGEAEYGFLTERPGGAAAGARSGSRACPRPARPSLGEHGYLQELSGTTGYRDSFGGLTGSPIADPPLESTLGATAYANDGIAGRHGYSFTVYLPDAGAPAVRESVPVPTFLAAAADAQKQRYLCYAWPSIHTKHRRRAFAINQAGEVFATANYTFQDYAGTVASGAPLPGAALVAAPGEDPGNLEGTLASGVPATDGAVWIRVP